MDRYSQETIGIKTLEEILELLRITEEYILNRNRTTELALSKEMLTVPILAIYNEIAQTVI